VRYIYGTIIKYKEIGGEALSFVLSFGGVWSLGALRCPPREQFPFQIHTQEAGPSQGPVERFALNFF